MLKQLQIENFALISKLDISFDEGFTTITGETGAGKSILLGALSLILGQRADIQTLLDKQKKCVIEGTFCLDNINIKPLFEENDLDYTNPCIFRREINQQGKSRAFINDTPVNLSVMKEIGDRLIDIHSQHNNLLAAEASFQFDIIDNYCKHQSEIDKFKNLFKTWKELIKENQELKDKEQKARAENDYFAFQLDELEKANLIEGEYENLESEVHILENAELIKFNFEKASYLVDESDPSIIKSLNEVSHLISAIENVSPKYAELSARIKSTYIEIKDIAQEIAVLSEDVQFDKGRIEELKNRYDLLNKLMHKHNSSTFNDLISTREEFREKVNLIESLDEQIITNEKKINEVFVELSALAELISKNRKISAPKIESEITSSLHQLGMPNARFKIEILPNTELTNNGIDNLRFLFNANLGGDLKELSKVASGGELSRLMLSIKSMISMKNLLPTIIFDEIDTGISGEIASKMGDILNSMSKNMQVIVITHLAQIAARGKEQLLVYKINENNQTKTLVKPLYNQERIAEIAKMLGGNKPSEVMLQTAKELMMVKNQ
ncbi:MAG: DNA repair protein RecN [Bacteroidetes bacterium]|nr:DNA repair protein RecN [Bacteroidota bacterium]